MDQNSLNTNPSNSGLNTSSVPPAPNKTSTPAPTISTAQTPTSIPSTSLPKITTPVAAMKKHVEKVGSMDSHKLAQWLFWVVLGVLVVIGGFLLYGQMSGSSLGPTETPSNASKIPEGFPTEIPIEGSNITSANFYSNEEGSNYLIVYSTDSSLAEKYAEYSNILVKDGYTIVPNENESFQNLIFATRGNELVSVVLYTNNSVNFTEIAYSQLIP